MAKENFIDTNVPRPLNCFLLYRIQKQKEIVAKCPGANHRDISKIIAKWWKEATEEDKRPFREQARLAKQEHYKKYPDYRYAPKKKETRKRAYIRKNKHDTFTSRSEENNKFMELIYNKPGTLDLTESRLNINTENFIDQKNSLTRDDYFPYTPESIHTSESPQSHYSTEKSSNIFGAYCAINDRVTSKISSPLPPSLTGATYSESSFSLSPYVYTAENNFLFPALGMTTLSTETGTDPNMDIFELLNYDTTACSKYFVNNSMDTYPLLQFDDLPMYQPIEYIDPMLLWNKADLI